MRPTTLCFPVAADGRLLLGCKKRGFGNGKWNGFGGKLEPGESFRECAVRELYEEVSLLAEPEALEYMGFLDFHFTAAPAADHITYIYFVKTWTGDPAGSEEMNPRFFTVDRLPYDRMWQGDRVWLPRLIKGERIKGRVIFAPDGETVQSLEIKEYRQ